MQVTRTPVALKQRPDEQASASTTCDRPPVVVAHRGWTEARTMIMASAEMGPRTIALLGPPGTGKTWLLRSILAELHELGQPATLLPQGDLPWVLPPGSTLLVDEAARMSKAVLTTLATQRSGLVVLTDLPSLADTLGALPLPPAMISLPSLHAEQVSEFAVAWLEQAVGRKVVLSAEAMARLVAHSRGTPRLITQFLQAAVTLAPDKGTIRIGPAEINELAQFRLGGLAPEPVVEAQPTLPPETPAKKASVAAWAAAGALVAAAASGLAWVAWPPAPPARVAAGPAMAPAPSAAASPIAAIPLLPADIRPPDAAGQPPPEGVVLLSDAPAGPVPTPDPGPSQAALPNPAALSNPAAMSTPGPVPSPLAAPSPAAVPSPVPIQTAELVPLAAPNPGLADGPPVPVAAEVEPPLLPTPFLAPLAAAITPPAEPAPLAAPVAPLAAALPAGPIPTSVPQPAPEVPAPTTVPSLAALSTARPVPTVEAAPARAGLVLIARRGDTLQTLYAKIYKGLKAPPFAVVQAANPNDVRAGAMVVFPEPPGGWTR